MLLLEKKLKKTNFTELSLYLLMIFCSVKNKIGMILGQHLKYFKLLHSRSNMYKSQIILGLFQEKRHRGGWN